MNQHYDLGYECAIEGGKLEDNPCHYECVEQASWEEGFLDGFDFLSSLNSDNDGFGHDYIWNELG